MWRCETCGSIVLPVDGVTAIVAEDGCWYHARCVTFEIRRGKPVVTETTYGRLLFEERQNADTH